MPSELAPAGDARANEPGRTAAGLREVAVRIRGTVARIFFDLTDPLVDVQQRSSWVDRDFPNGPAADSPPMDVLETEAGAEIVVDLPGIDAQSITITYRDGNVVIAGDKRPTRCHHQGKAAFHLAERSFGRFARTVKLVGALDASRARATLTAGELHLVIPRITERRGQQIGIPVGTA
jgi:HSP20 family protein